MIKKLRRSLSAKIFLVTASMLAVSCFFTYIFIAQYIPNSIITTMTRDIDSKVGVLVQKMETIPAEEYDDALMAFNAETYTDVVLISPVGEVLYDTTRYTFRASPSTETFDIETSVAYEEPDIHVEGVYTDYLEYLEYYGYMDYMGDPSDTFYSVLAEDTASSISMALSAANEYPYWFTGADGDYQLIVYHYPMEVNQAVQALYNILPWLVFVVLAISLLGSMFYARYVTRPIVQLSGISEQMANLSFDERCEEKRTDEIGVLGQNLNLLSGRLSTALDDLQQANASLKSDIERERELEQRRMAFFSAISHELKTPITILKGQLEGMLANVGVYKDRDKYLGRTLEVTDDLESMVQDILSISRMESTGFTLKQEPFNFSGLLEGQLIVYKELMQQRELELHADFEENLTVNADRALLERVVSNLISNAIHYTQPGEKIYIRTHKDGAQVRFSILNTGARIPEESLPHLFEAFYRVEQSRNRRTGGSGLGLYLVKMILDQHQAAFHMENTAAGVQFTMTLEQ